MRYGHLPDRPLARCRKRWARNGSPVGLSVRRPWSRQTAWPCSGVSQGKKPSGPDKVNLMRWRARDCQRARQWTIMPQWRRRPTFSWATSRMLPRRKPPNAYLFSDSKYEAMHFACQDGDARAETSSPSSLDAPSRLRFSLLGKVFGDILTSLRAQLSARNRSPKVDATHTTLPIRPLPVSREG